LIRLRIGVAAREASVSVVVITRRHDPTADLVILRLAARGVPVARFDVGDFPRP
jgi:hypothetical protein